MVKCQAEVTQSTAFELWFPTTSGVVAICGVPKTRVLEGCLQED